MDIRSKKIAKYFPKPARITAFIIACVLAAVALSTITQSVIFANRHGGMEQYDELPLSYEYTFNYRKKVIDMYEELCIQGVCELAECDENMEYKGNKYVMSDFLYYLDYNHYKYKKTDKGAELVTDMFDYYVSYTSDADSFTTDDETTSSETVTGTDNKISIFKTNISSDIINADMTESERTEKLKTEFKSYIMRCDDVISSDMTSSGNMLNYNYDIVKDGKANEYYTETYPDNFLPMGGWYHDNYGRYVYYFGNYYPIKFYAYPENTEQGRVARDEYDELIFRDNSYNTFSIFDMDDYVAYQGDTEGLTVFIAPKEGLLEQWSKKYEEEMAAYHTVDKISKVTALAVIPFLIYLALAAFFVREREREGSWADKVPFEIHAFAALYFLTDLVYDIWNIIYGVFFSEAYSDNITFDLRYVFLTLACLAVVSVDIQLILHIINVVSGRRTLKSLGVPKLAKAVINKYHNTELYKRRYSIPAGAKLRNRSITVLAAFFVTVGIIILMMWFEVSFVAELAVAVGLIAVTIFLCTEVRNIIFSRELLKLDRRISALNHNEAFEEKVDESSDIYRNVKMLDNISETVKEAVDDQIKSERMKIELIANVSHDLKTPLTSIISYKDLLKKSELDDEASAYVEILDKKSQKLKGIVADVFSLAKATSGIDVNMEKLDFVRLFKQSLADADDKIRDSGRLIKVDIRNDSATVMGDGNKLYRVFQNIIDNALKYSMENSRIFLEMSQTGDEAVFVAKNISSYPIDFTADEIIERFVRGDSSRTDGGSGLGLSIAKTFTEACGGHFNIELDGDMFKAIVTMPLLDEKEVNENTENK